MSFVPIFPHPPVPPWASLASPPTRLHIISLYTVFYFGKEPGFSLNTFPLPVAFIFIFSFWELSLNFN